jgi:hypothetical protein
MTAQKDPPWQRVLQQNASKEIPHPLDIAPMMLRGTIAVKAQRMKPTIHFVAVHGS